MKEEQEIEVVHDMLEETLRTGSGDIEHDDILNITIMRDTLCWVLDHNNEMFAKSIKLIREYMYGPAN